jgi:hypothetical protein
LTSPHLQQYQLIRGFVSDAGDWVGSVMGASMSVCVDGWIVGLFVGLFVCRSGTGSRTRSGSWKCKTWCLV